MDIIKIITAAIWLSSFIMIIYLVYYAAISIFSLKRLVPLTGHEPKNSFAVIIPARNESEVIGNLVSSLRQQDYPSHLFKIIVVPNNCTDDTKDAALAHGATVLECNEKVASKGEVLSFVFKSLARQGDQFDACCIFDADNLVEPGFLREMNNAICSGAKVAQGYRDSKNPADSWVSSCHSIYYYAVNRLYNHARSAIGLSSIINGTGFMVTMDIIEKMGGWNTATMTEDLEFSALCALENIRIHWAPGARFYDEQPITFRQSWIQRLRWSKGAMQCLGIYAAELLGKTMTSGSVRPLDVLHLLLAPWMQIIGFVSTIATLTLTAYRVNYDLFPQTDLFFKLFISLEGFLIFPTLITLAVVVLEKKNVIALFKGILMMWIFIMSWIPINLVCMTGKSIAWHPIRHTRSIAISELEI